MLSHRRSFRSLAGCAGITWLFFSAGCNKHRILDEERLKLEAERAALHAEIAKLDQKIIGMPDRLNETTLQRQIEALEKKGANLDALLVEQISELEALEKEFKPLKAEAEAFLARHK